VQSFAQLIQDAGSGSIAAFARADQAEKTGKSPDQLDEVMAQALLVMRESVEKGLQPGARSLSGMTGGQSAKLMQAVHDGKTASDIFLGTAIARALAVAECNAAMGRIVAAPTAGACGILPAVLLSLQEKFGFTDRQLVDALYVAGAVGLIIANRAGISGAQGGCQEETGTAAAMAAAAAVYLRGGSNTQSAWAAGFALMNVMGLVCDPVGGLVEVPCVYRNVMGAANALVSADLALAGIPCPLPPDEVVDAMKSVGDMMPSSLRETGEGGCASCPGASRSAYDQ
jgi:L-serine dehydratase